MKPEALAFLREIGTPESAMAILEDPDVTPVIDSNTLASYLRGAYAAGRKAARDPYRWYSVAKLIDEGRAR